MIDEKKVLAVIPARGGSKELPGKNIRMLAGKPLIAWTMDAVQGSQYIDRTILSSDDQGIIEAAKKLNCEVPFIRPPELATDTATTDDVLLHALDEISETFDYLILLQPTSPLRHARDIDGCLERCHGTGAPSCVTVARHSKPLEWLFTMGEGGALSPVIARDALSSRRQDLQSVWAPNGAVYALRVDEYRETGKIYSDRTIGFEMPSERSIDIDTHFDFLIAEELIGKNNPASQDTKPS